MLRWSRSAILIFLLLILFSADRVSAQLQQPGLPLSFRYALPPVSSGTLMVPIPDLDRIASEDKIKPSPYRFAVNIPVSAGMSNSGTFDTVAGNLLVWRCTLKAPGALAITLYFDMFRLPAEGKLFVYNPLRTELLGAFTRLNENDHSTFATSLINGDEITVEYNAPLHAPLPGLNISELAYAYRGVAAESTLKTGFGAAGKCQVNVACSEGDEWPLQKRSVTRIEVKRGGATLWCTGSVVNNSKNDGTPYVITADHCGRYSSDTDLSQWIFYFNYQGGSCPNPSKEPAKKSMTGASLVSHGGNGGSSGSDFFLVLLNQSIPDTFNVYYNGWSRSTIPSPSGASIHHPQGDIKKISTYNKPLVATYWSGSSVKAHWKVFWTQTTNGHGTTEPGSSGSPLYDNNGNLVGTLTGGDSSCDSAYLDQPDFYGMFSYSWDQNGSDSASVLKYWLDPVKSDVTILNGWALGVDDAPQTEWVKLFPNPVDHLLGISLKNGGTRGVKVEILDFFGKVKLMRSFGSYENKEITLDLTALPAGIWFVKISSGGQQVVKKIIKR